MSDDSESGAISPASGEEVALIPYYVYELVDPFNGEVFYVGKGTGNRAHDHGVEAETSERGTDKLKRIQKIKKQGKAATVRVVGRYKTEKEAFAVEATLIHWMYGYRNLSNVARGHGSSTIRENGDFDRLAGIDIPERRIGARDGAYTHKCLADRARYGVEEAMKRIKRYLEDNSELRFGPVDLSEARWTTIAIEKSGAKLVVGKHNSSSEEYWIEVQSLDGKKENRQRVKGLCDVSVVLEVRNDGAYAKIPGSGSNIKEPKQVLRDVKTYYEEIY